MGITPRWLCLWGMPPASRDATSYGAAWHISVGYSIGRKKETMRYSATHRQTNIWYNYFNHPPRKRSTRQAGARAGLPESHNPKTNPVCFTGATAVAEKGIVEMFRDMRRQERRHLDLLSSAGQLPGTPGLRDVLAKSIIAVRQHLYELDRVLGLMDPASQSPD